MTNWIARESEHDFFFFLIKVSARQGLPTWGSSKDAKVIHPLHKTVLGLALATKCQWHLKSQMSPKDMKHCLISPAPVISSWLRALTL